MAAPALLLPLFLLLWQGCRERSTPPSRLALTPSRIVTLAPNLTEIVFALGAGDRLAGVSDHSDYPPAARALPRVGGLEVSVEKVASLRPDLVLAVAEGSGRGAVMSLRSAGLPVLVVPSGSLDAALEGIRLVAQRLDRREAGALLLEDLEARRRAARGIVAAAKGPRPRAVLLIWPDPPQAAGGGTLLNDVLVEAGAENLLAAKSGWPIVSAEFLATAPLDVLVVSHSAENAPAYDRAFHEGALSRGRPKRVRVIRLNEDALTRPGPRVFTVLQDLATLLHPPDGR